MEYIPVSTRALVPPKDDLLGILDASLPALCEGDVVLVTSKVVAIHEGRCVPVGSVEKDTLIMQEADYMYVKPSGKIQTISHSMLVASAGIDESNGDGHYVLLPEDAFESAQKIHAHLTKKHGLKNLGVVITDSHSLPLRYGSLSATVGCWGFEPVEMHTGKQDIFGRITRYAKSNKADALAAASALVSGECDERVPIVIARGVPNLVFTDEHPRAKLFVPMEDDFFKSLFSHFSKRPD